MFNYNLILGAAIVFFFVINMVMILPNGDGVLYFNKKNASLRFPSWRAHFNNRFVLLSNPVKSLGPTACVSLFARSDSGCIDALRGIAKDYYGFYLWMSPLLCVVSILIAVVIPFSLFVHLQAQFWIGCICAAYAVYVLAVSIACGVVRKKSHFINWTQYKIFLEPLLCLPYANQVLRKFGHSIFSPLPLIDLLESNFAIDNESIINIIEVAKEYLDIESDIDEKNHLEMVVRLATSRSKEINP